MPLPRAVLALPRHDIFRVDTRSINQIQARTADFRNVVADNQFNGFQPASLNTEPLDRGLPEPDDRLTAAHHRRSRRKNASVFGVHALERLEIALADDL